MSPVKANAALQHAALGLMLVGIVVLVTVCFNLVGILSCSILTGLILGASRQCKWHMLPASLVFPGATLVLLEFSKADILPRTRILLSVVCWVGFVVTYLVGYVVVYLERHASGPATPMSNALVEPEAPPASIPAADPDIPKPPSRLTLEMLKGNWSYDSPVLNAEKQKTILQVEGDQLLLSVTDAKGQVICQAKGRLKVK